MNRTSLIKGAGGPSLLLPYRSGDDTPRSLPLPPLSVHVTSPFMVGVLDIRWEDPSRNPYNTNLQVLGVNVYRSFDSPNGKYEKLNIEPVSSLMFRDQTREILEKEEDVLGRLNMGNNPEKKWFFHTRYTHITDPGTNGKGQASTNSVLVEVDAGDGKGFQRVTPAKVVPEEGLVYLNTNRTYDPFLNTYVPAVLPSPLNGGLRITYHRITGLVATDMHRRLYYKVTTVAKDGEVIRETPLGEVPAQTPYQMEKTDWVWTEAIRRNRWLLEREGERVKVFLKKWNGVRCPCFNEKFGQSKGIGLRGACFRCFGTGYVGGYEGPYDALLAPPETEKTLSLMDAGFHVSYDWNTWTGPEPLLNDRDVVIRMNNDRYFVSRPNPQGSRGAIYQQQFSLSHVDQSDIIYSIPITGGEASIPPSWNSFREGPSTDASPQIPITSNVREGVLPTGRTVTFENITV